MTVRYKSDEILCRIESHEETGECNDEQDRQRVETKGPMQVEVEALYEKGNYAASTVNAKDAARLQPGNLPRILYILH